MSNCKLNTLKANEQYIKNFFKKRNIDLIYKEEGTVFRIGFTFIKEDKTIFSDNVLACVKNALTFNSAMFCSQYLFEHDIIDEKLRDYYQDTIQKLYNLELCYS